MDLSENALYAAKNPPNHKVIFSKFMRNIETPSTVARGRLLSDTLIVCKIQQDEHDATPARLLAGETTETPDISG